VTLDSQQPTASAMYKHKPLSLGRCIRILLLHPNRDHGAPIRISLQEATLPGNKEERAPCEALSYVWGTKTGDQEIECEGSRSPVTKNCLAALRSLRRQDEPRRLWIDSICIDQAGGQEKNYQLKLMGDIYSRAQRVLVWLRTMKMPSAAAAYTWVIFMERLRDCE
jgi:hypothetical protein